MLETASQALPPPDPFEPLRPDCLERLRPDRLDLLRRDRLERPRPDRLDLLRRDLPDLLLRDLLLLLRPKPRVSISSISSAQFFPKSESCLNTVGQIG